VTHLHFRDLPHGFVTMSVLPRAREAIAELATELRAALHA
jgi:acetyl esterase/lipase